MNALLQNIDRLCHRHRLPLDEQPNPAGLSKRELEVLRVLAAGRSNREIAERLFVSPNTVANHVRNILAKTGTSNRTEAAAYARRFNLLSAEPADSQS
jgi:DNA-binding NarL/FixJ family response regulator